MKTVYAPGYKLHPLVPSGSGGMLTPKLLLSDRRTISKKMDISNWSDAFM